MESQTASVNTDKLKNIKCVLEQVPLNTPIHFEIVERTQKALNDYCTNYQNDDHESEPLVISQ